MGKGGVGAFDGARPDPGNDGKFLADKGLQIRAVRGHVRGNFHLRVEMPDTFAGLLAHPVPIAAHVLGEALRAFPAGHAQGMPGRGGNGADGSAIRKFRGNLDHGLVDGHGHGVEVGGPGFQPEALGFQRQRAASGKGIMKGGELFGVEKFLRLRMIAVEVAGFPPRFHNGFAGFLQNFLVGGVFPLHQFYKEVEQVFALLGCGILVQAPLILAFIAGIIDHLRKDNSPCGSQRPTRPPQMQGAGMPVPDGFFARGGGVDGVQRQGRFYQLFGAFYGLHGLSLKINRLKV